MKKKQNHFKQMFSMVFKNLHLLSESEVFASIQLFSTCILHFNFPNDFHHMASALIVNKQFMQKKTHR